MREEYVGRAVIFVYFLGLCCIVYLLVSMPLNIRAKVGSAEILEARIVSIAEVAQCAQAGRGVSCGDWVATVEIDESQSGEVTMKAVPVIGREVCLYKAQDGSYLFFKYKTERTCDTV